MRREDTIIVHFNSPGHPYEFTLHLPGTIPDTEYIPNAIAFKLVRALAGEDVQVDNRGSRLEVFSRSFRTPGAGEAFTPRLLEALTAAVRDHYDTVPEFTVELTPVIENDHVPALRPCPHCNEAMTLQGILGHLREARASAPVPA